MITTTLLLCALTPSSVGDASRLQVKATHQATLENPVLRLYEVADLDFDPLEPGDRESTQADGLAPLLAMIRGEIALEQPTEAFRLAHGTLVANLPPAKHAKLAALLEFQRSSRRWEILLETSIIEADRFLVNDEPVNGSVLLEKSEQLTTDAKAETIVAPSIIALPARSSSLFAGEEIAYVADYEIVDHIQPGDVRVEVPRIEHIKSGVIVNSRAHWVSRGTIELTIKLEVRDLVEFQSVLDADSGRQLNLPIIRTRAFSAHAVLGEGQSLLVTGDPGGSGSIGALLHWGTTETEFEVEALPPPSSGAQLRRTVPLQTRHDD